MESVFLGIAEHCEDADTVAKLREVYLEEAKHYGPQTVDHSRLAADFVDAAYQKHDKAMKVLRLCCQDILAPAAIHLKRAFDEKASFKDMRGNWYIDIYLDDKDSIRVTHAKREQAFSYDEDEYFEFLWELTVRLNRDYSGVASANVEITDLKFNDKMKDTRKAEIKAVMSKYLAPALR